MHYTQCILEARFQCLWALSKFHTHQLCGYHQALISTLHLLDLLLGYTNLLYLHICESWSDVIYYGDTISISIRKLWKCSYLPGKRRKFVLVSLKFTSFIQMATTAVIKTCSHQPQVNMSTILSNNIFLLGPSSSQGYTQTSRVTPNISLSTSYGSALCRQWSCNGHQKHTRFVFMTKLLNRFDWNFVWV